MSMTTVKAHYDGKNVCLDEEVSLTPNARLLVTVVPEGELADEREEWFTFAMQNFASMYGDDEPEYTLDDVKEKNPDYVSR